MLKLLKLLLLSAIVHADRAEPRRTAPTAPNRLRVEYMNAPLGVDKPLPRFSWALTDPAKGATQTAYTLTVAKAGAAAGDTLMGAKAMSNVTQNVAYSGPALTADTVGATALLLLLLLLLFLLFLLDDPAVNPY